MDVQDYLRKRQRLIDHALDRYLIADDLWDAKGLSGVDHEASGRSKEGRIMTFPSVVGMSIPKARVAQLLKKCLKGIEPLGRVGESLWDISRKVVERAVLELIPR